MCCTGVFFTCDVQVLFHVCFTGVHYAVVSAFDYDRFAMYLRLCVSITFCVKSNLYTVSQKARAVLDFQITGPTSIIFGTENDHRVIT